MRLWTGITCSIWIAIGAVLLSCTDAVTAPSISGSPFLAALVDGMPWRVDTTDALQALERPDTLLIAVQPRPIAYPSLFFTLTIPHDTIGTHLLAGFTPGAFATFDRTPYQGGTVTIFVTDSTHRGEVFIAARDTVNQIVTGTFSYTAVDPSFGGVISVVEGQFRLHYSTTLP